MMIADDSADVPVVARYLLGDLPEADAVQVEERAFSDAEYRALVEAVESDLIDAYVRGGLAPPERQQFENRFLASAERRRKVQFARALAQVADESRRAREAFSSSSDRTHAFVRYALVAASVLLAVALAWQTTATMRLRGRVNQLEAQRREGLNREEALSRQLPNGAPRETAPPIAAIVLIPGMTRGETARVRVTMASSTQLVRIEIRLDERDRYERYRAVLRTRSGDEVAVFSNLSARPSASGRTVAVDVPATTLTAGDVDLTLQGIRGGTLVDLGYWPLTIETH